jgi:hypothetical protein
MFADGQLVQPNADGSRPGYKGEKFLVKIDDPKKLGNVIEQKFIEVTGSKNRPETYKKTGVKKTLYKPQIIVKNKTVLTSDFGTKDAATAAVKKYREKNPIKNAPPDLKTLDKQKKKKYLDNKERTKKISKQGGVESFETGDKIIHKGHSQNIDNPNVKIKPGNIIYTPQKINQSMAGSEGKNKYTDLDYKIDEAENKIKKIKNSKASAGTKKKLLAEQDNLLMKYVAQSDGYKTVTLSNNKPYGEIFQKSKSMDMFDEFSNMTEKETKKFVNQYFTDEGKLKDKWTKGNISNVDKANIKKSYTFLENIKNAKANAKQVKGLIPFMKNLGIKCQLSNGINCMNPQAYTKSLNELSEKAAQGNTEAASKLKNFSSKALKTGKVLKNALGPLAIASELAIESGIALNKTLETGVPFKTAFADSIFNLALGPKLQIDKEAELAKEFAKGEEYAMAERGRRMAPFMAQSKAADERRLRDRMNAEGILTIQDAKNELKNIGDYYGQGYTPYGLNKLYEDAGMQNPGFGIEKVGPRTGKYNEEKGLQDYLNSMKMQKIADAGGVANLAGGGIAKEAGDRSGAMTRSMNPDSQGLSYLFNRVKKV